MESADDPELEKLIEEGKKHTEIADLLALMNGFKEYRDGLDHVIDQQKDYN